MPKDFPLAETINSEGHLSAEVLGDKFRCYHNVYFVNKGECPEEAVYHTGTATSRTTP